MPVTALVGQTGSGKSTIADLIIRLYDPNAGSIIVDDTDLRKMNERMKNRILREGMYSVNAVLLSTIVKTTCVLSFGGRGSIRA